MKPYLKQKYVYVSCDKFPYHRSIQPQPQPVLTTSHVDCFINSCICGHEPVAGRRFMALLLPCVVRVVLAARSGGGSSARKPTIKQSLPGRCSPVALRNAKLCVLWR